MRSVDGHVSLCVLTYLSEVEPALVPESLGGISQWRLLFCTLGGLILMVLIPSFS